MVVTEAGKKSKHGAVELGELERVDLRDAWKNEAQDFTPWLAQPENLERLGRALGLQLEVQAIEQNVGPFRADVLCKEIGSEGLVLIENQLEATDHNHLGQILTYAAGLEARKVVWIAARFTGEHPAALDWLNRNTSDELNFFGIEVELWRIGKSEPAPRFHLVAWPNEWSQQALKGKHSAGLSSSERAAAYRDLWTALSKELSERGAHFALSPTGLHWIYVEVGIPNFRLVSHIPSPRTLRRCSSSSGARTRKMPFRERERLPSDLTVPNL